MSPQLSYTLAPATLETHILTSSLSHKYTLSLCLSRTRYLSFALSLSHRYTFIDKPAHALHIL